MSHCGLIGLILKRGKFSRSSGQWQDEDYDVLARRQGRGAGSKR
jgi:hypothetical protein